MVSFIVLYVLHVRAPHAKRFRAQGGSQSVDSDRSRTPRKGDRSCFALFCRCAYVAISYEFNIDSILFDSIQFNHFWRLDVHLIDRAVKASFARGSTRIPWKSVAAVDMSASRLLTVLRPTV